MLAVNEAVRLRSEPLTWEQICARYPNQWVCLVEVDRPEPNNFEFRTARVVGYGKERRDPWKKGELWLDTYKEFGHYYTGRLSPQMHLNRRED